MKESLFTGEQQLNQTKRNKKSSLVRRMKKDYIRYGSGCERLEENLSERDKDILERFL